MLQTNSSLKTEKGQITISFDQFIQVVEAILEGRYSWACVLFLRFAGFNPLHYIPYRTYNRLIKLKLVDSTNNTDENQENEVNRIDQKNSANEELASKIATKLIDRSTK